jgi:hypothetical protein
MNWAKPSRGGDAHPSRGSTRRRVGMPRIPGAPVQRVNGGRPHGELGCVGAANDNRTRAPKAAHNRRVIRRDEIRQSGKAVRRCLALLVDIHLNCDRNSEQRPRFSQQWKRAIGSGCRNNCLFG